MNQRENPATQTCTQQKNKKKTNKTNVDRCALIRADWLRKRPLYDNFECEIISPEMAAKSIRHHALIANTHIHSEQKNGEKVQRNDNNAIPSLFYEWGRCGLFQPQSMYHSQRK